MPPRLGPEADSAESVSHGQCRRSRSEASTGADDRDALRLFVVNSKSQSTTFFAVFRGGHGHGTVWASRGLLDRTRLATEH